MAHPKLRKTNLGITTKKRYQPRMPSGRNTLDHPSDPTLFTIPYDGPSTRPPACDTPTQTQAVLQASAQELDLKEVIGQGGMGLVYLAEQKAPLRRVAVKRSHPDRQHDAQALIHEAMLAGALEHPNIVPIHMVTTSTTHGPEVVMKYIEGNTLETVCAGLPVSGEPLRAALSHLIQVCHALEYAHSRGVIHRDVKPANIMIGDFGEVYLLDWGIALELGKPPPTPQLVGTPAYMAPEMVDGDPRSIGPRTDVYLLGATLHHLLTGAPRHRAKTVSGALQKASQSAPVDYPLATAAELADLCNRACAVDPADRPASVASFRAGLEHHLKHWQALKLVELANMESAELRERMAQDIPSSDVRAQFERAAFAYGQALHIWDGCTAASSGLRDIQATMVEYFLNTRQLDNARDLLTRMDRDNPQLRELLEVHQTEQEHRESEAARLREIGTENDPMAVRSSQRVLAIAVTLLSGVFVLMLLSPIGAAGFEDSQALFAITAVMFVPILLGIWLFRGRLSVNVHGRRAVMSVTSAMTGILIHRGLASHYGRPAFETILVDMILIGLATVNASPSLRAGPFIAAVALWCIPFCMVVPSGITSAGVLMGIVMGGSLLYEWVFARRFRPPTPWP